MKKVVIPVTNGRLSEFFGSCSHYEIFEIDNGIVQKAKIEIPPKEDLSKLPEWISNQGITDVIVYKIDKRIIKLFTIFRINLFVGIAINSPQILIESYISGKLKSNEKVISEIMA